MFKQVIVIRKLPKSTKGQVAVWVAQAALRASDIAPVEDLCVWMAGDAPMVVLKTLDASELNKIRAEAYVAGMPVHEVSDGEELVCVGIGPVEEGEVDWITGQLKCY